MPKLSFIIYTASFDDFASNKGIPSYFAAVIDNLKRQTFKDFEFVYVDTYFEYNRSRFEELASGCGFQVKHVAVHKDHRYWYDQGHTYLCAAKNTGILYADGELVAISDDGEFFPDNLLELYWTHYKSGVLMGSLFKRYKTIKVADGFPVYPIEGELHNWTDPRTPQRKLHYHTEGGRMFSTSAYPMDAILQLNGFNEFMDGTKGADDTEFATRLAMLPGIRFVQDVRGYVCIFDHSNYMDRVKGMGDNPPLPEGVELKKLEYFIAVENYGMTCVAAQTKRIMANECPPTEAQMKIIQAATIQYRKFDPLSPEHAEQTAKWMATPCFDLAAQRDELRKSSDWRWG